MLFQLEITLGVKVTAFSPLGNGQSYSKLGFQEISSLKDPVILNIAQKLNVTAAQVCKSL